MQQNNEDLVTREMNNNEIRDSLILEKVAAGREVEKREILVRTQSDLGNYLRNNLEPEDIFIDDETLDNEFDEILHQNILNTGDGNVDFKITDKVKD